MRLEITTGAPPPRPPALEVHLERDLRRWLKLFAETGLYGDSESEVAAALIRRSIEEMLAAGMISIGDPPRP